MVMTRSLQKAQQKNKIQSLQKSKFIWSTSKTFQCSVFALKLSFPKSFIFINIHLTSFYT